MLTDKQIAALKPKAAPYRVADGNSLYIQVSPSGGLLWRFRYRYLGKAKMLALGVYPKVRGPEARQKAGEARQLLEDGIDPGAARREAKETQARGAENTFRLVAVEWQRHAWGELSDATKEKLQAILDQHIYPTLGDKPMNSISTADVLATVKKLTGRGILDIAKRALSTIGRVFSFAVVHGLADSNPAKAFSAADIIPRRATKHHDAITDPKTFGAFIRAADAYTGGPIARAALQLSVLLYQRPIEMRTMEWQELDLDAGLWNLPASKMKMRVPHAVPLPEAALAILREMQKLTGQGRYVFPSNRSAERPLSENTVNAVIAAVGFGDLQTAHGLRASARTMIAEQLNFPPEVVEASLAHLPAGALGATYARVKYLEQRKEMAEQWASYLDGLRIAV